MGWDFRLAEWEWNRIGLKPIFGNYRNWLKYGEALAYNEYRAWLLSIGWRPEE